MSKEKTYSTYKIIDYTVVFDLLKFFTGVKVSKTSFKLGFQCHAQNMAKNLPSKK